jgi:hypothetical protein
MKYQTKMLIGLPIFFVSIYFLIKSFKKSKDVITNTSNNVILMGGLDNRSGDLNINQQADLLKSTLKNKNVMAYRYNDDDGVINAIKKNPKDIVVLFSAGCFYSNLVSEVISNKKNLFIVEPYATSTSVRKSVNEAINNGVPNKNVVVGTTQSRGLNVVENATHTPSNYIHWDALKFVGTLIK